MRRINCNPLFLTVGIFDVKQAATIYHYGAESGMLLIGFRERTLIYANIRFLAYVQPLKFECSAQPAYILPMMLPF